jgi:hypothetical protein
MFVFAVAVSSKGQVIENRIQKQIDNLKLSNVDTFLIYSFACYHGESADPFDTCTYPETQYLFWIQNTKTFLKRFDYCKTYKAIQLDTTNPIRFYLLNKRTVDKEEIKKPTCYEIRKTKKGVDTLINTSFIDHSCYHQFNFWVKNKSVKKVTDIYDLEFEKFDDGKKNIYYSYNQNTKLKALIDKISNLLQQLDTDKKFEVL